MTVTAEHWPPAPPPPPVAVTKTVCVTCGVVSGAGTTTVVVSWPLEVDTVWLPPIVTVTTLCVGRTVSTVDEGCSGLTSEVALTGTTTLLVSRPVEVEAVWPPPSTVMVTTLTVGMTVCTVEEAETEPKPPPFPPEPPPFWPPPLLGGSSVVTCTVEDDSEGVPLTVTVTTVGTLTTVLLLDPEPEPPDGVGMKTDSVPLAGKRLKLVSINSPSV